MLILVGVTVTVSINGGLFESSKKAKLMTEFSLYKEDFELYNAEKSMENGDYNKESLTAGKTEISYNTKNDEETGNIKTVIRNLPDEYIEKFEVIKGILYIKTKDKTEIAVAKELGILPNPYDIIDGVLISSNGNLLLMDETGTVTIPDSVTEIGEGAFANLEGLKTIIIPGTVKKISTNAFAYNTTLEKVIMKEGVEEIGSSAFRGCSNLKEVELPESLTSIKSSAFYCCYNLQSIEIPSKIQTIENNTFAICNKLSNVKFRGNEVTKIEAQAFYGTAISEFDITKKVTSIDSTVFSSCKNLIDIKIDSANNNFKYENKMLLTKNTKDNTKYDVLFVSSAYYKDSTELSIPNDVKNFYTGIGNLTKLKTLNIPSSLESVKQSSFPNSIEEINVDENNNSFKTANKCLYSKNGNDLIYCYSKDENITIEEGVLTLKKFSFKGATNAKIIKLPDSLTTIEKQVFQYNTKLQELKIGKGTSSINGMFKLVNYSGTVTIDEENPYYKIENNILYSKDKKKLCAVLYKINGEFTVDSSVEEISAGAFACQISMTKVKLLTGMKKITSGAFYGCTNLTSIEIPNSVTYIGASGFSTCPNLTSINIDNTKDSISGAPWGATKGMKAVIWGR